MRLCLDIPDTGIKVKTLVMVEFSAWLSLEFKALFKKRISVGARLEGLTIDKDLVHVDFNARDILKLFFPYHK